MLMPHQQGTAPVLAVDAVTGLPYKGAHQLVLADVLDGMASAKGAPVDPRFIAMSDADLLSHGIPAEHEDAAIELRPRFVGIDDRSGRIDSLTVWPVEFVPGMDAATDRQIVLVQDLVPTGAAAPVLEPDDLDPEKGLVGAKIVEVASDPNALPAVGFALWVVHGTLVAPLGSDAAQVVGAARDILNAGVSFPPSAICEIANMGQVLAESFLDQLVSQKSDGARSLDHLEDRIAIEHAAPCPDLHRAERNCWTFGSLRDAATLPNTAFESKNDICSRIIVDAHEGAGIGEQWLDRWLRRGHKASASWLSCSEIVTVDWEHATRRDDEAMLRRAEAVKRGEAPPVKWKLQGIGPIVYRKLQNGDEPPTDVLESIHSADSCALLVGMTSTRSDVLYAVLLLHSPLGRGSCNCNGEDWVPLESSAGALWYSQHPGKLTPRIGESGGSKLGFTLHREYRPPVREGEDDEVGHVYAARLDALAMMAEGAPSRNVWDMGFTAHHAVSGDGDRLLVLSAGISPLTACIVPSVQSSIRVDESYDVTVGTKTTTWRAESLPRTDIIAVVSQTEDALIALKTGRASVTMTTRSKTSATWLFFLDLYEVENAAA